MAKRASTLAIGAHPDDVEFMCCSAIGESFGKKNFAALILTNGAGSSRGQKHSGMTNKEMIEARAAEQNEAAKIGDFAFVEMWGLESKELKNASRFADWVKKITDFLNECHPQKLYTHNPFDRHETHVVTSMAVLEALRQMDPRERPLEIWGCEVWRSLDWLDYDKTVLRDLSAHKGIQKKLVSVFHTQNDGKNYPEAVLGRKTANAVFRESHASDKMELAEVFLDMRPFVETSQSLEKTLKGILEDYQEKLMSEIKKWKL